MDEAKRQELLKMINEALERTVDQGGPIMQYDHGKDCLEEGKYDDAYRYFKKAADAGLSVAQYMLGEMYLKGLGVDINFKEAYDWYYKAAMDNFSPAQYTLGLYYDAGVEGTKDEARAYEWFLKAADNKNADAYVYIGHYHQFGTFVKKDMKKAFKWYKKAADEGSPDGLYYAGMCYFTGDGVFIKNVQKGAEMIVEAASCGCSAAKDFIENYLQ